MNLSIIIPTFNRNMILKETLSVLYEAVKGLDAEIIVVNDSKSVPACAPEAPPVPLVIVENPKQGPASARNYGAKRARGSILLFVDNDIWVSREALLRTLQLHEERPNSAFNLNWTYPPSLVEHCKQTSFGRYLLFYNFDSYRGWAVTLDWERVELFAVSELSAFYLSILKVDFDKAGGFCEAFLFQGMEDSELSKRLGEAGIRLFVDPTISVQHNEADRITLHHRFERGIAGGYNRRTAVDMGRADDALPGSYFKRLLYRLVSNFKGILLFSASMVPNLRACDGLYRTITDRILAASLYRGYYRKK